MSFDLLTNDKGPQRIDWARKAEQLERELTRYKRLEAILRDRSDVVDVKDSYNEVRANAEMQALTDWEAGE